MTIEVWSMGPPFRNLHFLFPFIYSHIFFFYSKLHCDGSRWAFTKRGQNNISTAISKYFLKWFSNSILIQYFYDFAGRTWACVHDDFHCWNVHENHRRWLHHAQGKLPTKSVEYYGLYRGCFWVSWVETLLLFQIITLVMLNWFQQSKVFLKAG